MARGHELISAFLQVPSSEIAWLPLGLESAVLSCISLLVQAAGTQHKTHLQQVTALHRSESTDLLLGT